MKEALKKLDRKFLIFAGCLILIPVVIIIFLAIIQGCGNRKVTHEKYEDKMISAAEKYVRKKDLVPTEESEFIVISLETLVSEGYIKSTEKLLDDSSCEGEVKVRRNGADIENDVEGFLNYTANLTCDGYNSNNLKNLVLEDLTSEDSGLYKVGDSYIFKGNEVNNYLDFFGVTYRIVSIDKNGVAKILKEESEAQHLYWDMKYNSEIKQSYGKNIYEDSFILEKLNEYYKNNKKFSDSIKTKLVANDVCVDSRNINDYSLVHGQNCKNVLENQRVGLLNVTDFANASLDPECTNIDSKSCKNYNYMGRMSLYTWTMDVVSNNTYEVFYLVNGSIEYQPANKYYSYNFVLYIDSDENIVSGNGSKEKPYVIK